MLKKIINNKSGLTLMEIVVTMALFIALMLSATRIFQLVIDGQRNAIASQNLQDNMRYAFEVMAKEIRNATPHNGDCAGDNVFQIYDTAGSVSELYFKNQDEECVKYYLDNNRLKINRDDLINPVKSAFIMPDEIEVSNLQFIILDNESIPVSPPVQANVTIVMDIKSLKSGIKHEQPMKVQTTISSRYYE